ncbi:hypothetical protein HYU14_07285 [Candidatus Woesearchaeota archaeon]|nr:hypothetical protein [Candidatus Woesearchaeota archaeon]
MKKLPVIVFVLLLSAFFAHAYSFEVSLEPIDNVITLDQKAKYQVTVENTLNTPQVFNLKTLDYPLWEISTDPIRNPITLSVGAGSSESIILLVNPLKVGQIGAYDVNLLVKRQAAVSGGEDEALTVPLRVNIATPEAGEYVETVIATITAEEAINPLEPYSFKVKVDNQNALTYENITVRAESNNFLSEAVISLGRKEKKTLEFTETFDPQAPPGTDTLIVMLLFKNRTLDTKIKKLEIQPYQHIRDKTESSGTFLRSSKTITYVNEGNYPFKGDLKIPINLLDSLFTSSQPKGHLVKKDGMRYLAVGAEMPPGGEFAWKVTKNYFALVVLVILALLSVGLYFLFRAPVILTKSFANVVMREGGVSELKVIINAKNRGKEKLHAIEVIDKIPNIADLEGGLALGTLHPISIRKHEKKGTIIKWVIDDLEPNDERVITYKLKSHLPILGQFTLSPSLVVFSHFDKKYIVRSNSIEVGPAAHF